MFDTSSRKRKPMVSYDSDDDEYNQLGSSSSYTLTKKIPSLTEQEKEAEESLCDSINQINSSLKSQNKNLVSSPLSITTTNSTLDDNSYEISKFFSQNIINYDNKIKIIVIGKARVGKSLFISKLIDKNSSPSNIYIPTAGLDIRKTNINIDNLTIKLEIIDTNDSILNSNIIKTYYQVCNGCIIISNNLENDLDYLEKHLEVIHSISSEPSVMIIVNNCSNDVNNTFSGSEINNLVRKYYINNKDVVDISKFNKDDDINFKEFIRKLLSKKNLNEQNLKLKNKIEGLQDSLNRVCILTNKNDSIVDKEFELYEG